MNLGIITKSKPIRIALKGLKVFLLCFVVLFAAAIIYVSVNKTKIIADITKKISVKINGKVEIGTVELSFFNNFPKIAVKLNDIKITDTLYPKHQHIFFESKSIFATLSISKLISKKPAVNGLKIQDGKFYLFTDSTGYSNGYLLNNNAQKSAEKSHQSTDANEFKTIKLDRIQIIVKDDLKGKFHDLMLKDVDIKIKENFPEIILDTKANIQIKSLAFNIVKGSFLSDKLLKTNIELHYNTASKELSFPETTIKINGNPMAISGRFGLNKTQPQFQLNIQSQKMNYEEVKLLLPQKIASSMSKVSLDGKLLAEANIKGPLNGGEPTVNINFKAENSTLTTPFLSFQNAHFTGYFTNLVDTLMAPNDPNSCMTLKNLQANWNGLPIHSNLIQIKNLSIPELLADLKSSFPLNKLNQILNSRSIEFQSGTGLFNVTYKGPLVKDSLDNAFLNGNVQFKDGQILYKLRNVPLKNVQGEIQFNNADLYIKNIQTLVLGNSIVMNGSAKNLLNLVKNSPGKVTIDYNVFSPSLNLGVFKFLLKKNNSATKQQKSSGKNILANSIDAVLEEANIHLNLKANKLIYQRFVAENVLADVTLLENKYIINNVSLQHADGNMQLNGELTNNSNATNATKLNVKLANMNVKKLFTAFNNFGQDGITDKSLEGNLSAKISANLLLKDDAQVVPSSINSTIDFSLKNGALKNYDPLKKIQSFIFKNRDFNHIQFAELKNTFTVKNQEVTINRMEIQSNVLYMFVEGLYSNRGNTDISIQIPINNLKKREEDYIPENIGINGKTGKSVFLRGQSGTDGNIKFKLDLFNRYNKQKNKAIN